MACRRTGLLVAIAALGACSQFSGGCSGRVTEDARGGATVSVHAIRKLSVEPHSVTVRAGGTQRFSANTTGTVTWRVEPAIPPVFPLKASVDGRHLVDQRGAPFRIHGDSAWSLIANLTLPEVDLYLADRKARGFNTLLVNLLEHRFAVNAPALRNGEHPFLRDWRGRYEFSKPNERYFLFADAVLDKAAARGFAVLLDVMYSGYDGGDEGWWKQLSNPNNDDAACFAYGQFLGSRWKNRHNIVWVLGGDFTPPAGSKGEQRLLKILAGLRAGGATQIVTAHNGPGASSVEWPAGAPALGLNGVYPRRSTDCYSSSRAAYARAPAVPAILLEPGYESEGRMPGDAASIRSYAWWGQLSAIGGMVYGHRDIWPFQTGTWGSGFSYGNQPWQQSLDAPGARAMDLMGRLLATLPWHKLVPAGVAGMRDVVTSGVGQGLGRIAAAVARDRSLLLAYIPPAHSGSLGIDMKIMSGPSRARWWNPATGEFTSIGVLPNEGEHTFTPPGENGTDWVLVLQHGDAPSCGAIDAAGVYSAPPVASAECLVVASDAADASLEGHATLAIVP